MTSRQNEILSKGRWINSRAWQIAREMSDASGGDTPVSFYRYAVSDTDAALTPEGKKPVPFALKKARRDYDMLHGIYAKPEDLPIIPYEELKHKSPALFKDSEGSYCFYVLYIGNNDDNLDVSKYQYWQDASNITAENAKQAVISALEPEWDAYDESTDLYYNIDKYNDAIAAGYARSDILEAAGMGI